MDEGSLRSQSGSASSSISEPALRPPDDSGLCAPACPACAYPDDGFAGCPYENVGHPAAAERAAELQPDGAPGSLSEAKLGFHPSLCWLGTGNCPVPPRGADLTAPPASGVGFTRGCEGSSEGWPLQLLSAPRSPQPLAGAPQLPLGVPGEDTRRCSEDDPRPRLPVFALVPLAPAARLTCPSPDSPCLNSAIERSFIRASPCDVCCALLSIFCRAASLRCPIR